MKKKSYGSKSSSSSKGGTNPKIRIANKGKKSGKKK